ncbi:hypothetical protein UlMin_001556 [Ulmus minor]
MNYLRRNARNQPPFTFLEIFQPTKHQNSSLSTITLQNPDVNPNKEAIPANFSTHLVHPSNLTEKITTFQFCKSSEFYYIVSSNKMISRYVRAGDLDSAMRVFERMAVKTTVTWNSILAGYAKKPGKMREAHELFDKIPEPDCVSYNTMLVCYLHNKGVSSATKFFERMPVKDTASWNTMISGFAQNGKMERACELFREMPEKNSVSWSAMISGYIECGDLESAVKLFEAAPIRSIVVWTAMVTGFMKFGKIELAEKLFHDMPVKNLVTWNAMIAGYIENGRAEDGLKLFRTMIGSGVKPNPSSLSSVLLGCSNLCALQMGKQVHQLIYKSLLYNDTTAGTSLVSMYCKCGDLEDAQKLFLELPRKDIVTWNAMITGYAQHGAGQEALNLFDEMRHKGIRPDWITFVAVLSACNHAGLVDIGVQYFDSMARDYLIGAKPEHYICMVDLLGRAGRLVEAVDLIRKMPFKPHQAIFGTLLGACRIHKNLELAEYAAKNLLALDPSNAAGYVQLANVYAASSRWDCVSKVWRSMKENKVIKAPGYSWIEIKSVIHEFRSSDRVHPELASIHEKLIELEKKMKLAGYVPVLESALHDVGEEQKEKLLLWHSEKLAIAFGLLKVPAGIPIRVFKNLRVCGDCHRATMFISAIEKREIIVRDTTRFHHFQNGVCSCGGYW